MKKIIPIILLVFVGCASQAEVDKWKADEAARIQESNYNPCTDPRFLALRAKPIDSLSIREYDFLRTMEDRCNKFTEESNTSSPFVTAVLITLGILATIWVVGKIPGI